MVLDRGLLPVLPDAVPERLAAGQLLVQLGDGVLRADQAAGHTFHTGAWKGKEEKKERKLLSC